MTLDTLHRDLTLGFAGVQGELGELRTETRAGFAAVQGELGELRTETRAGFAAVQGELGGLRTEMGAGFTELKTEMRAGFADLKVTMITGFRNLPSRESADEMVRLLRDSNRLHAERLEALQHQGLAHHQETLTLLRAMAETQRRLGESQHQLAEAVRAWFGRRQNGGPGGR